MAYVSLYPLLPGGLEIAVTGPFGDSETSVSSTQLLKVYTLENLQGFTKVLLELIHLKSLKFCTCCL